MTDQIFEGGCICGAVRYRAEGQPLNVRLCHCRICQQVTGQPFNARAQYRAEAVEVSGAVTWWNSSDAVERGFCPACGVTIFGRRAAAGLVGFTLASMDAPATFEPADHIWTQSALPWVKAWLDETGAVQFPQAPA
ncbi:GFA family protein [Phenylobacterium immobile]|uniref:GFA family protein n=1 Tax=Phenylobacterium immobile TaxID=21 RepID=UPI000AFC04E4|nr:GFA family protein [Phenylobacterium immobile]